MKRQLLLTGGCALATVLVAPMLTPDAPPAARAAGSSFAIADAPDSEETGLQVMNATVIDRDASGQFYINVLVNGEEVNFLIDTGADAVALTVEDAERIGLDIDPESFEPVSQTASGIGYGAIVQLDRIELGSDEFRGIDAMVIDGLGTNLLGQSVLGRLGKVELQGDRMIIHHAS